LIVDVGAGVGTVGLATALSHKDAHLVLVEKDAFLARLARENLVCNDLGARGEVVEVDVLSPSARRRAGLDDGKGSLVLTNPPFFMPEKVRASPNAGRASAHILAGSREASDTPLLTQWLRASAALLAPGGRFVMIYRCEALHAILAGLEGRLGAIRILPIYPHAGAEAIRILVSGTKGSRAPLALRPGLVLHDATGRFTAEAEAIHRGEAFITL
jgi:tRNA1(Val) A37 N6-methylase TrmN6